MRNVFEPYRYPKGIQPDLPYGPDYWGINKPVHVPGEAPEVILGHIAVGPNVSASINTVADAFRYFTNGGRGPVPQGAENGGVVIVPWRDTVYPTDECRISYQPSPENGWLYPSFTIRGEKGPGGKKPVFHGVNADGACLFYGPNPKEGLALQPSTLAIEGMRIEGFSQAVQMMGLENLLIADCEIVGGNTYTGNGIGTNAVYNTYDKRRIVIVNSLIGWFGDGSAIKHSTYLNIGYGRDVLLLVANCEFGPAIVAHRLKISTGDTILVFNNKFPISTAKIIDWNGKEGLAQETVPIDCLPTCRKAVFYGNEVAKGDPEHPEINWGAAAAINYIRQVYPRTPNYPSGSEGAPLFDMDLQYYLPGSADVNPDWLSEEFWDDYWSDGYAPTSRNARITSYINNDFVNYQTKASIPAIYHCGIYPFTNNSYMSPLAIPLESAKNYKTPNFLAVAGNKTKGFRELAYTFPGPEHFEPGYTRPAHWVAPTILNLGGNGDGREGGEFVDVSTLPSWAIFDPRTSETYRNLFGEYEMTDETNTTDVVEVVKQAMAGLESYVAKVTTEVTAEIERQAAAIEAAQNSSIDPDERNAAIVAAVNASSARIMALLKPLDDRNEDV